jgi:hypothetical protein
MPPPETEAGFTAAVIDFAHVLGWTVAHFRPARTAHGWRTPVQADGGGFPDLVLVRERVVFAEVKAEQGRLAPAQRAWREHLEAAGAEWHEWRPSDWPAIVAALGAPVSATGIRDPSSRPRTFSAVAGDYRFHAPEGGVR